MQIRQGCRGFKTINQIFMEDCNLFSDELMDFSFNKVSYKKMRDREIGGFWVFN